MILSKEHCFDLNHDLFVLYDSKKKILFENQFMTFAIVIRGDINTLSIILHGLESHWKIFIFPVKIIKILYSKPKNTRI